MITQKMSPPKSKPNTSTGFQTQTQTISVTLIPNKNSAETTESISPTEITGNSIPSSQTLIPGITIPLQVPTESIRSNADIRNDPSTSEKSTSQG